jgi:hypothetical protein
MVLLRVIACLQVESHLSHAPLATRKVARALAVFLLSYATAFMETLTISHVSEADRAGYTCFNCFACCFSVPELPCK